MEMHKKKAEKQNEWFFHGNSFSAFLINPVPLARELFAHPAFRLSWIAQNAVLASDLAAFHDFLKSEGP
jgi:hypothetical protein